MDSKINDTRITVPKKAAKTASVDTITIKVRYFASARAAAGVPDETVALTADSSVKDVLTALNALHGESLIRILESASFLLDGIAVRNLDKPITSAPGINQVELDVLPPFAGG